MKYKWVQSSPGCYKLVDKDDPRPEVKLKSALTNGSGSPYLKFNPSWKKYEDGMWSGDKKTSMDRTDKFLAEREHALKTDSRAKNWEEGRKKEWARNKPYWVKDMQRKGEL